MFPDYHVVVDSILQDGPIVGIFGSTSGSYKGNEVGGPSAWKAVAEKGKVRLWQVYADYTETWKIIKATQ